MQAAVQEKHAELEVARARSRALIEVVRLPFDALGCISPASGSPQTQRLLPYLFQSGILDETLSPRHVSWDALRGAPPSADSDFGGSGTGPMSAGSPIPPAGDEVKDTDMHGAVVESHEGVDARNFQLLMESSPAMLSPQGGARDALILSFTPSEKQPSTPAEADSELLSRLGSITSLLSSLHTQGMGRGCPSHQRPDVVIASTMRLLEPSGAFVSPFLLVCQPFLFVSPCLHKHTMPFVDLPHPVRLQRGCFTCHTGSHLRLAL